MLTWQEGCPASLVHRGLFPCREERNILEAASNGAATSVGLVANIAANLIAFLAVLEFINAALRWFGEMVNIEGLTFQVPPQEQTHALSCQILHPAPIPTFTHCLSGLPRPLLGFWHILAADGQSRSALSRSLLFLFFLFPGDLLLRPHACGLSHGGRLGRLTGGG